MSYCPQYSYWLNAEPTNPKPAAGPDALLAALEASPMADPEGCMTFWIEDGGVHGEVDPKVGTMSKDDEMETYVAVVSSNFPEYRFTLDANDEEDKSNKKRTVFEGGNAVYEAYARTLEPGEVDQALVEAVSDLIVEKRDGLRKEAGDFAAMRNYDMARLKNAAADVCQELLDGVAKLAVQDGGKE